MAVSLEQVQVLKSPRGLLNLLQSAMNLTTKHKNLFLSETQTSKRPSATNFRTYKKSQELAQTETKKSCDLSFPFLPFPCASKRRRRPHHHFSHETAKFYQTQILRMATRLIDQAFSSSTSPPPRIPSFPQYPKQPI